jgi:hypothetical protein
MAYQPSEQGELVIICMDGSGDYATYYMFLISTVYIFTKRVKLNKNRKAIKEGGGERESGVLRHGVCPGMKTVRIFSDRIRDRIRLEEF